MGLVGPHARKDFNFPIGFFRRFALSYPAWPWCLAGAREVCFRGLGQGDNVTATQRGASKPSPLRGGLAVGGTSVSRARVSLHFPLGSRLRAHGAERLSGATEQHTCHEQLATLVYCMNNGNIWHSHVIQTFGLAQTEVAKPICTIP